MLRFSRKAFDWSIFPLCHLPCSYSAISVAAASLEACGLGSSRTVATCRHRKGASDRSDVAAEWRGLLSRVDAGRERQKHQARALQRPRSNRAVLRTWVLQFSMSKSCVPHCSLSSVPHSTAMLPSSNVTPRKQPTQRWMRINLDNNGKPSQHTGASLLRAFAGSDRSFISGWPCARQSAKGWRKFVPQCSRDPASWVSMIIPQMLLG